ncbi:sulfite exporter TauE/SafE family protein [Nitrincola nitratireducens]|uniref:Probable membrane transporter protein n=1 Tax=Nitrincola nitratireducens TaxID=1229521 RepID=W9V115_9GAMM|nr:sulfite exporter TauE/SafE family protein [Nitrincola nitratireducens]EXJ09807.1 Sulfite exporter TauE/SafE [Nitrincola nitratireducens]
MEWLLPAEIAPWMGIFLVIAAGFTAAITSSIGVGGGVLLLALMAISMPPAAVIPVHGMVQLGSNFNRAIMTLQHIDWKLLATFTPGACLGAVLASHFLVQLPISMLQLSIAGFISFSLLPQNPSHWFRACRDVYRRSDHDLYKHVCWSHRTACCRICKATTQG